MQQNQNQQNHQSHSQRTFTASEVAEFEYCPLVWWYEQFEPLTKADTEELFAHLVEMEHEYDAQAPTLPEYQMVEQLLVRRGAFEEGRQQHLEHAQAVEEIEEERVPVPGSSRIAHRLTLIAIAIVVIALLLLVASLILH